MTDAVARIVDDCRAYWQEVDILRHVAEDMGAELEAHLHEAEGNGRNPHDVVGDDVARFAMEWASEQRSNRDRPLPTWDAVQSRLEARATTQLFIWVSIVAVLAVILAAMITSGKESGVDNEVWRWVWVGIAVFMSVAEIFSAGFFMLPFAIGASFAAAAAWLGLNGAVQWVLFFATTGVSMLYLRRFMRRQDDDDAPAAGAHRYVGMTATVIESIDMAANTGMVRVQTDEWRAISEASDIPEGAAVEVLEVRGTRLLVAEVK